MNDLLFMQEALKEAYKAYIKGEVPVGAVIVKDDKVIAKAHNLRETLKDPTSHAEIIAIRKATDVINDWRLTGCTLYVTIEPCPMCAGAILQSRIDRLVVGSKDEKGGACGSRIDLMKHNLFNHNVDVTFGILENECSDIMKNFFKTLRRK
ncbi:tRNA(adenine34) deaminase [Alkalithermobacter thermoalcaliphilus JW-YL-7 = DSM 7308]|uniref:tRNA-specific adenosine deaminase n=1 Tax=Alkalithermobacter thermoalcaliphilus JW-YL-7 = DSM 7308 TaxID=1121328 RepID=A0A150FT35_CLOPD|nr:CMP/dCMP deaminase zinc-binding protein [[Clostridium] paradoxum JW-YL-7 = DSM 7308]SHL28516.1 tRNA(adenine34) deaminase [[Clostridium] paradoxum JW-YL-7 = DSM 7308]